MIERFHIYFIGHVQGVGFRFTTEHIAKKFSITGYVKNLVDGRVEVVAEGESKEINAFIRAIKESPLNNHIRDTQEYWEKAQECFKSFRVSY